MAIVLIVDDDETIREAYTIALEQAGYKVFTAEEGAQGLVVAERENPDVILLDILMPFMGGMEFLRHFHPVEKHPNVKVIALTNSEVPAGTSTEALKLGARKYLRKSTYTPAQIVDLVKETLAK